MIDDPIVDEIRRIRDEHAAKFGYDLDALVRDLREQERASGDEFYEFAPKPAPVSPVVDGGSTISPNAEVGK